MRSPLHRAVAVTAAVAALSALTACTDPLRVSPADRRAIADTLSALVTNAYDFSFLAPCPASGLILHGQNDTVVPPVDVERVVSKLRTQKGIVIGHRGARLKEVGTTARRQIEKLLGTKVYLELRVKVAKNWQQDPKQLGRLGF